MNEPSRFRAALLAICALGVIGLWLAQANPYLNPADDSGRYMVLGESLAKTGDLRLINDVRRLRDTLYVPGLPALVAVWLRATGRDPGGVVLPIKATLMALLLVSLPLFYVLLDRAGLRRPVLAGAMIAYAACPALISYANEVMSELPLLVLCLGAIVLATARRAAPGRGGAPAAAPATEPPSPLPDAPHASASRSAGIQARGAVNAAGAAYLPAASLALAAAAYYVRAAGVILLLSLAAWFWRTRGPRWGMASLVVTLLVVGTWQVRSSRIIAHDPPNTPHDTYMRQFTLKNPDDPTAGRIQLNALGIASRIKRCFPPNIGNIPRAVLYSMGARGTPWQGLFYLVAVPFTLLVFGGYYLAWRSGQELVCGFCTLYWLFVALWPWISPRFLVPLIPYILLFAALGTQALSDKLAGSMPPLAVRVLMAAALGLLLFYYTRVHWVVIPREHAPTLPGYELGRTRDEAGFYAAATWLRGKEEDTVVMSRPPYLMYLYSRHPTTQIEPSVNPRVQERAYMIPNHVRYLVVDTWSWAHTENYLGPYLRAYGGEWTLVWQDPGGSGVRIYRRNESSPAG
jgi:hypothetical protein